MKTTTVAIAIDTLARVIPKPVAAARVAFMDNLRYLMVLFVHVYHAVGAYAVVAPHWVVHDTPFFAADICR